MNPLVELEFGLVAVISFVTGAVSYWVYRDASDRGMDHAAHWGAAVGLLFLFGLIVGGLFAVGAYISYRPDREREPVDYRRELEETTRLARETADESRKLARDTAKAGKKAGQAAAAGATVLAETAGDRGRRAVEEDTGNAPGEAAVDAVEDVWEDESDLAATERTGADEGDSGDGEGGSGGAEDLDAGQETESDAKSEAESDGIGESEGFAPADDGTRA